MNAKGENLSTEMGLTVLNLQNEGIKIHVSKLQSKKMHLI